MISHSRARFSSVLGKLDLVWSTSSIVSVISISTAPGIVLVVPVDVAVQAGEVVSDGGFVGRNLLGRDLLAGCLRRSERPVVGRLVRLLACAHG